MYRFFVLFMMCILGSWAYAYDFKVTNAEGAELCYRFLKDGNSVMFTYDTPNSPSFWEKDTTYKDLSVDTLHIPNKVQYDDKEYSVTALDSRAFCAMNERIKVVVLPSSVDSIFTTNINGTIGSRASFYCNNLHSIEVEEANSKFKSIDGILYTSDGTTLIAYPALSPKDSIILPEGIKSIAAGSMSNARKIKFLELPNSLTALGPVCLEGADSLRHLIIKDNIQSIGAAAIGCLSLTHLTLGAGIQEVNDFVYTDSLLHLYCRAIEPPTLSIPSAQISDFLKEVIERGSVLYVPMRSLSVYQQAPGWSGFQHILPIEPPIVTGINSAEVSWVQNFSATGYVWTLYLDEAKAQRFMSLTFDASGHLINIDFGTNPMPRHTPVLYDEVDEENTRLAEYYSFTISGLTAETTYYYTRQTLNGTDVIDEESGSFQTLSNELMVINHITENKASQKIFKNGQIYILNKDRKYTLNGACITK